MGIRSIRDLAAKHSLILSAFAILAPLVFAGVLLVNAATNQLNEQYRQRLMGGLSTYGVFLNYTMEGLERSINKLSADTVLQISINSNVSVALERFLEVQAHRYDLDFLSVIDNKGQVVAAYTKNPEDLAHVTGCQGYSQSLLAGGAHLYLASTRKIKRYGQVLGTLCGGSTVNQPALVDSLRSILRGTPFLSFKHQAFPLIDNGFSYSAAVLAPIGQMFIVSGDGETVYGMMGELTVGSQTLGIGLLVPGSTYQGSYTKAAIAVLISLLVMVLIGLIAIRSQLAKRHAQVALKDANQQALVTLSSIGDTVITTNKMGKIEFINLAGEHLIGVTNNDVHGSYWQDVIEIIDEASSRQIDVVSKHLSEDATVPEYEHLILKGKHKNTPVKYTAAAICERGAQSGVVLVIHDVSKEYALHRHLDWKANHDELTRLPNRASFNRQLESMLEEVRDGVQTHALLFLDLDRFKVVNDTCGHAAGDTLLKEVCQLFSHSLRDSDTLARLGGDEFGVLLRGITVKDALKVGNKLVACLREYRFQHQCQSFSVGVSIGLVGLGKESRQIKDVLKAADAACYVAKAQGRNQVQCASEDTQADVMQHTIEWMPVIRQALDGHHFSLGRKGIAVAALSADPSVPQLDKLQVNLKTQEDTLLASALFLPPAKRYGLMRELDRHVLTQLLADSVLLDSENTTLNQNILIIPISDDSITDDEFPGFLQQVLSQSESDLSQLCFSIPEVTLVANFERVKKSVAVMQSMSCQVMVNSVQLNLAIFEYLELLAVNFVEIEGYLIQKSVSSHADFLAVKSINALSRELGIKTVIDLNIDDYLQPVVSAAGFDFTPIVDSPAKPALLSEATLEKG